MSDEDKMSIDERYKYLQTMQKRYHQADRGGKSQLLDEMEAVTRKHRKHLIRQMNGQVERWVRQRQRKPVRVQGMA